VLVARRPARDDAADRAQPVPVLVALQQQGQGANAVLVRPEAAEPPVRGRRFEAEPFVGGDVLDVAGVAIAVAPAGLGIHGHAPEAGTRASMTRTVASAARAATVTTPTWKLPVAVVVRRRLVLSQKTRVPAAMAWVGSLVSSN